MYDTTELAAHSATEALVSSALNVGLSRISLPDHGAECRPEQHLLEPRRSLLASLLSAVDPVVDPLPSHIKPCHKISPGDELELVRRLLSANMCILLDEDLAPLDTAGGGSPRRTFLCEAQVSER